MIVSYEDGKQWDNNLTKGSSKKIIFLCEDCNCEVIQSYKIYMKSSDDKHYCRKCRNIRSSNKCKDKKSNATKNNWKNLEYRNKVSSKISKKKKEWWNNIPKEERVASNKRSFNDIKKKSYFEIVSSEDDWIYNNKLVYKCKKGHEFENINIGSSQCPICNSLDYKIEQVMKDNNYTLLKREGNKITYSCDNGHIDTVNWKKVANNGCSYCNGTKLWEGDFNPPKDLKVYYNKWQGKRTICYYTCKHGYTFEGNIYTKKCNCEKCTYERNFNKWSDRLKKENYKLLNIKDNKIYFICNNNHTSEMFCSNWMNGQKCGKCFKEMSESKYEIEMREFLKDNCIDFITNDRTIISPKELDIYIPEHKIAIEFNGIYWHTEKYGKDRKYHLNKTIECENKNIQLIHIFEDEWTEKKEIVKSIILSKLGKLPNRLYARKCEIKLLDSKICNNFLNDNHLQGSCNSSIKLGLFYNNELVSCMTFGKRKITGKSTFELLRFCNKLNYFIIGGASKLFKYFLNNYNTNCITTYADRRYSNSNFYEQLGFEFSHNSNPSYWYFKEKREHRSKYMKHKLSKLLDDFDPNKTEYQNMLVNGYTKIWDCGCKVYKIKKDG